MESIGIVINTIEANMRTEDLLKQSQSLAEELQSRQQELQQTNQELQEKARLLAHQNEEVERKNQEVEQARQALEDKAKQLALTSKYKSEFLANMSHELRTPLNSLLILSDQLCKNPEGNLSAKQTESAKSIHSSGNDLLMLINDILDLSKIESGTVVVDVGELRLDDLYRHLERTFRHVAESKGIDFLVRLDPRLPKSINTDVKRLQQIIKNLLSNAFKFTHHGQVALAIEPVTSGWNPDSELNRAHEVLAFSVRDTGIGISPDKQQIVFEAFQQADGSTSRKYGGTGLGLAISRELAKLLGGEIRLVSNPGSGSTFVLYLPHARGASEVWSPRLARRRCRSRASISPTPSRSTSSCRTWRVGGCSIASSTSTRHIPVCVISTDDARERASSSGALGFIAKPIQSRDLLDQGLDCLYDTVKRAAKGVLVVAPVSRRRERLIKLIEAEDLEITALADAGAALRMLKERRIDCLLLDARIAMDPAVLAQALEDRFLFGQLPVIVYSDGKIPHDETAWKNVRDTLVVRHVRSEDRLVDQAAFLLHRSITRLPEAQHRTLEELHRSDKVMEGKQVLIVDDDMRNILDAAS